MKRILLALLASFSFHTSACQQPIVMQVGSFFDSASVVTFWGEFSQDLSIKLKCPTNLHPSATYKEHLIKALKGQGDIFVIPYIYARPFEKYQLKAAAKTISLTKAYLVTNKTINPHDLNNLSGKTLQLPSIYSAAYLSLKVRLIERKAVFNEIQFKFGNSFQSSAMDVVKGKVAASIVFSPIFDALPDSIKKKVNFRTINQGLETGGYLMVKSDASPELINAIQSSHKKIKLLKWTATHTAERAPELSDLAAKQLKNISKQIPQQSQ